VRIWGFGGQTIITVTTLGFHGEMLLNNGASANVEFWKQPECKPAPSLPAGSCPMLKAAASNSGTSFKWAMPNPPTSIAKLCREHVMELSNAPTLLVFSVAHIGHVQSSNPGCLECSQCWQCTKVRWRLGLYQTSLRLLRECKSISPPMSRGGGQWGDNWRL
jgi:hypothetical protein